ncbi:MAG: hypothetical protein K2Y40_13315 [Reyranella sp.]|jgi:hypothetical protein|nr:hypothetical protein [Reyranella sp.]
MPRSRAAAALALVCLGAFLGAGPAAATCEDLDDKTATLTGTIEKVDDIGVILFVDSKSGCRVGLVESRIDRNCRKGGQIEATGHLTKNKYAERTYSMSRGRKAPADTLVCR